MARFLIDAGMPRPTAGLIASYGHSATDVRDIGLGTAADSRIAAYAQAHQLILLSRDQDFGNIRDYPPDQYHGIAVIAAPAGANRALVLALVEQLLRRQDVIAQLAGRLAIIQFGRIRLRPPP
jgi:hypothetical protein